MDQDKFAACMRTFRLEIQQSPQTRDFGEPRDQRSSAEACVGTEVNTIDIRVVTEEESREEKRQLGVNSKHFI